MAISDALKVKIRVLMVGGRRAGKTSILASLSQCAQELTANKNFKFDGSANMALDGKAQEMKDYFSMYDEGDAFEPDLSPTPDMSEYTFDVQVRGRDTGFQVVFTDIPGEWLVKEAQKVDELIAKSNIVIIAIDSPHLMEKVDKRLKYGVFHREFNRADELLNYFRDGLQSDGSSRILDRMVLFTPIKCEKYYWLTMSGVSNRMKQLKETVHEGYKELFDHLASPELSKRVSVAITPVITIGGAEFYRFDEDSYVGEYCFVMDPKEQNYYPRYCEQPLLRILDYVLTQAENKKKKQGLIGNLINMIQGKPGLNDLLSCHDEIKAMLVDDENLGFETVQ